MIRRAPSFLMPREALNTSQQLSQETWGVKQKG